MKRSMLLTVTMLALLAPIAAPAITVCVGNAGELASALSYIPAGINVDEIRLRPGNYSLPASLNVTLHAGEGLILSGGWVSLLGECNFQAGDATSSVLDGQGQHPVLQIVVLAGSSDVVVRNLSIANGNRTLVHPDFGAGGLTLTGHDAHTGDMLVERVRFVANESFDNGGALRLTGHGKLTVRSSLFLNNVAPAAAGMLLYGSDDVFVVNNTATGNLATNASTSSATMAFVYGPASSYVLTNNLFWGNVVGNQKDLYASSQTTLIRNNVQVQSGAPSAASTANGSVDPQFEPAGEGRLQLTSPLINDGVNAALGGIGTLDVANKTRATGIVDLGAYESERMFFDGFE